MNHTLDDITRACGDLLRGNRVNSLLHGQPFRYTRPAPSTYEQQWLWDSCFHAICLRWLDPAMAWDELRAVVAHAIPGARDSGLRIDALTLTGRSIVSNDQSIPV